MVTSRIDFSAFTVAMSDAEIDAFRPQPRAAASEKLDAGTIGCLVVLILIVLGLIAGAVLAVIGAVTSAIDGNLGPAIGVGAIGLFIGGLILLVSLATRGPIGRSPWEKWTRLDRFARENGMSFQASSAVPDFAGAIFGIGADRSVENRLTADDGSLDIGNYLYATGHGKGREVHSWGYLALRLDRQLPHLVLDSRANNGVLRSGRLPSSFDSSQVLSLEGDFNTHFTLYAPTGSETAALYVFTPDLMALLIDEAAAFDVEIVDDWMFVYSPTPFDHSSAETYWRLFRIVDTVGAKALATSKAMAQADSYVETTAPEAVTATESPARRLRRARSHEKTITRVLNVLGVVIGIAVLAVSLIVVAFIVASLL